MPQMAPIMWLPLFIFFFFSIIMLMCTLYFLNKAEMMANKQMFLFDKKNFFWKW
uniref:ATP synthase F0 subunit 8 n=1 Tax=Parhyale hawaiensis TaxID=317513 RepID=Q6DVJ0_9CRUS|nr:ATP synthase F0 subunit 8 [Parhyale hawaiensis]AAT69309.1 ATP synthase F0 subunit 8 [Parhyale hawaiensis]AYB71604.1 ATP synthase F0 subunit 8 [Parhyale hawaiensis]